MRIATIVGARPQFIKAAVVSRALKNAGVDEVLIHTGQHYDEEMSAVFFDELELPRPAVNLNVGSGSHAAQTGEMLVRLESFLLETASPDFVLVYGDTNSTIAGALVASKLHMPVAHVEAGLRSFNRKMPEEINRVVTDRLSAILFCPTQTAVDNLAAEGVTDGVHLTGDVMLDATLLFADLAEQHAPAEDLADQTPGGYVVATIHRAENTDVRDRLEGILAGLGRIKSPVILPLHPRTRVRLDGFKIPENVQITTPVGYLSMLSLIKKARAVLTDSGGLQKEAIWLGVPCVTLRDETEWVETLERGWNQIVGADADRIEAAIATPPEAPAPQFAEPGAPERIVALLTK